MASAVLVPARKRTRSVVSSPAAAEAGAAAISPQAAANASSRRCPLTIQGRHRLRKAARSPPYGASSGSSAGSQQPEPADGVEHHQGEKGVLRANRAARRTEEADCAVVGEHEPEHVAHD